jgi:hypothetical protein
LSVADFSHLRKLDVDGAKTARYELMELEGEPVLIGVFAGETNKPYWNSVIKRGARRARRRKATNLSAEELQDHRDHDRELFPKYVIKGWEGVVDVHGAAVEFTQENCAAFIEALPYHIFDDVRNFFCSPESFSDDEELSGDDAEALGKPLPPD